MSTPVRPAQGALAVRSMLYVSIAAAGHFKFDFKKVPAKMQGASVAKSKGGAPQRASVG